MSAARAYSGDATSTARQPRRKAPRRILPRPMKARPSQGDIIRTLNGAIASWTSLCVSSPTGSGKTLMAVASIALNVGKSLSHAVIIAPQRQIEEGFSGIGSSELAWPDGFNRPPIEIRDDLILPAEGKGGRARAIRDYLASGSPGHAIACTHSSWVAFTKAYADEMPEDLKGFALYVDEAHHVAAPALSASVQCWRDRGGLLLYFTATPSRADGLPVACEGMRTYRLTLPELMLDGYAPRRFLYGLVSLGEPDDVVDGSEFLGKRTSKNPAFHREVARKMVERWERDGRPKFVVAVPVLCGGCDPQVEAIMAAFKDAGGRVFNAVGTKKKRQKEFLAALRSERGRPAAESEWDGIVGVQRVKEGMNWPHCSTVYCLGIPGSIELVIQLLGRGARLKPDDYPGPDRDVFRIVFFVPNAGGNALSRLEVEHSRHSLLLAFFLADLETAQHVVVARAVRAASGDGGGQLPYNVEFVSSPEDVALAYLAMGAAYMEPGEVTPQRLIDAAKAQVPQMPEADINKLAIGILASDPKLSEAVQAAITVATRSNRLNVVKPDIAEHAEEGFAVVLREYRDAQLGAIRSLEAMDGQLHALDGKGMLDWAERLSGEAELLEHEGRWQTVAAWAKEYGVGYSMLRHRLKTMTLSEALTEPLQNQRREPMEHEGRWQTPPQWAKEYGISNSTLHGRLNGGMSLAEALGNPVKVAKAKLYEHDGHSQTIAQWAAEYGLSKKAIRERIKSGKTISEALANPSKRKGLVEYEGRWQTIRKWAAEFKIKHATLLQRLKKMDLAEALAKPLQVQDELLEHAGRWKTRNGWAKEYGMSRSTLVGRLETMTLAEALATPTRGELLEHDGRKQKRAAWAREYGMNCGTLIVRLKKMPLAEAMVKPARERRLNKHR